MQLVCIPQPGPKHGRSNAWRDVSGQCTQRPPNTHPQPPPFLLVASASSNLKSGNCSFAKELTLQSLSSPITPTARSGYRFCLKLNIESKSQIQSFCHITVAVAAISFSTFLDISIREILKASNGLKQKSRKNPHFGLFRSDIFLTSF